MHEKNLSGFQDLYCLQFTFTESNVNEVVSAQFRRSVVSDSLQPHESQHARPPCPSPTPGVDSNSCPSSRWCSPAISSSGVPFSSCLQSLPASGSFPVSQLFTSGGQSIGVSASASVLPINTQDWSPLGWTGWISLQSNGLSRVFSNTTVQKHQFFGAQLSSQSNSHIHIVAKLLSHVRLFATPWTVAYQAPQSMEFSPVLQWVAISFSKGSSQPRDRTQVSHTAGRHFTVWASREAYIDVYKFTLVFSTRGAVSQPVMHPNQGAMLQVSLLTSEEPW